MFGTRHPSLRDALLWSIPAVLFGLVLRTLLLSYSPYAFWGSDSNSFFSFAYRLLTESEISLYDKRRYLYPIFLLPLAMLPGSVLMWVAWVQHALGLATVIALGYTIRKVFYGWKLWIVPITALYAGMPLLIWYEHELLAETLFFDGIVWAIAAWTAWVTAPPGKLAAHRWWWLLAALASFALTKASGRFFWPGIILGLVVVAGWKRMNWWHAVSLVVLIAFSFTIGQESQAARLVYTSVFPLTRLDTPLHADYKEEVRDLVEDSHAHLDAWYALDTEFVKGFIKNPGEHSDRPLWAALENDKKLQTKIYGDLAKEAIRHQPHLLLYFAIQRMVASANLDDFKDGRFDADYFASRFEERYDDYVRESPRFLGFLFGLPRDYPFPAWEEFKSRLSPAVDSRAARWFGNYVRGYHERMALVREPENLVKEDRAIYLFRPTALGWWIIASVLGAFLFYRRTLGVWSLATLGYLMGTFLVGTKNPRFFAAAWPVLVLVLPVLLDSLLLLGRRLRGRRFSSASAS